MSSEQTLLHVMRVTSCFFNCVGDGVVDPVRVDSSSVVDGHLGLFAAKDFHPGDVIFREKALVSIGVNPNDQQIAIHKNLPKVIKAFLALPPEQKENVLSLSCMDHFCTTQRTKRKYLERLKGTGIDARFHCKTMFSHIVYSHTW